MNARIIIISLVLISAASCATQSQTSFSGEVIATVTKPKFTGWFVNYCDDAKFTKEFPDCLQVGGEIFKVKLVNIETANGTQVNGPEIIALPAHALHSTYKARVKIYLAEAPEEFRNETGIKYFAKALSWGQSNWNFK